MSKPNKNIFLIFGLVVSCLYISGEARAAGCTQLKFKASLNGNHVNKTVRTPMAKKTRVVLCVEGARFAAKDACVGLARYSGIEIGKTYFCEVKGNFSIGSKNYEYNGKVSIHRHRSSMSFIKRKFSVRKLSTVAAPRQPIVPKITPTPKPIYRPPVVPRPAPKPIYKRPVVRKPAPKPIYKRPVIRKPTQAVSRPKAPATPWTRMSLQERKKHIQNVIKNNPYLKRYFSNFRLRF